MAFASEYAPRYTVRSHTLSWQTAPDYWYVWDEKYSAQVGGRFPSAELAQDDADDRNLIPAKVKFSG
jgi:hypothetical protein